LRIGRKKPVSCQSPPRKRFDGFEEGITGIGEGINSVAPELRKCKSRRHGKTDGKEQSKKVSGKKTNVGRGRKRRGSLICGKYGRTEEVGGSETRKGARGTLSVKKGTSLSGKQKSPVDIWIETIKKRMPRKRSLVWKEN